MKNKLPCSDLKAQLPQTTLGSFSVDVYCQQIETASYHAEQSDDEPDNDFPDPLQTKVYKLAKRMCQVLGNNWKHNLID